MTFSGAEEMRLEAQIKDLKARAEPFAMATVVRTVNATSAKPGGKALVNRDGEILLGWVGGGCARGAVSKAARKAIEKGEPQFISLRPQELLESDGVKPGEKRDGVQFERNGCPSEGTMDIFIEPVLPLPKLIIFGQGLVASALGALASRFDFNVEFIVGGDRETGDTNDAHGSFVVVATQGSGDLSALRHALSMHATYTSFVGSRKKFAKLVEQLVAASPELAVPLKSVHAPAGLSINAITPEEIALSILAQITEMRRGQEPGRGHIHSER